MGNDTLTKIVNDNLNIAAVATVGGAAINILFKSMDADINPYFFAAGITLTTDLVAYSQSKNMIKELRDDVGTYFGFVGGWYIIETLNYVSNLVN